MTENEIVDALRLSVVRNIGSVAAKKLIQHCGSPTAVFGDKMQRLIKIDGIGLHTVKGLFDANYLQKAELEYKQLCKEGYEVLYFQDERYPERLKHCPDAPVVLFQKGNIQWDTERIISVVGTRNITKNGERFCRDFIEAIAPLNPTIISGFAYGVDITIQRMAYEKGLQTIGCLAHGLDTIYPKVHSRYERTFMQHGGFVSEFWTGTPPDRENFLKRNRIIAGLSEATVVIESAEKGGSLITADLANGYHRDVFAVPGRVDDPYSAGCNNLIKSQKAHMMTSAADLVYILGWDIEKSPQKPAFQQSLFIDMDAQEKTIYGFLRERGKQQLDTVVRDLAMPVHKVSTSLLTLEMKGVVRPSPGKWYELV
ncbi:MAG: DNA-processing protein DprA [Bacteroidota bacterium]